ncbi:MAG TPA: hypothetical protein ENN75_02435 [candidate division Zixibacteria bacterium]|nr:hypothetical protein [candidate division Zixibacteria bacterium]
MIRVSSVFMMIILIVAICGCKKGSQVGREAAVEAAENAVHYNNVLGVRDIAMRIDIFDKMNDPAIDEIDKSGKFEFAILDPDPAGPPEAGLITSGWEEVPWEPVFYEKLTGAELGNFLAKLTMRDGGGSWGSVETVVGEEITNDTILDECWIVPMVFIHEQMIAPLAGSGSLYRIDVILDKDLKLISIIKTGGQTWIS